MVKYFMREIFEKLKDKKIFIGFIIVWVVNIGVLNKEKLLIGCYVGDVDFYIIFGEFFDFFIEEYYCGFKFFDNYVIDMDYIYLKGNIIDLLKIIFIRIRVVRNIFGFNLVFG